MTNERQPAQAIPSEDAANVAVSHWTVTRINRLKGRVDIQGPADEAHSVSLQR